MTAPETPVGTSAGAPPATRQQPGRRRALGVLAVVGVVLLLGTAVDFLGAAEPEPPPAPVEQGTAAAGSWYCPSVAGDGETATLTIAAAGEETSSVIVERYAKGRAVADDVRTVEPGAAAVVKLEGEDAAAPTAVRWTGGAAVATWRVNGERSAAAPCEPAPSRRWHVVGFDTNLGLRSTLHLFNPFAADAVVRLIFATPEGEQRLVLADNILIGAGGTTSLNLRKYQPEIADLGVIVEVLSGRVVAQGEQTIAPPPRTSGASGRLLLSAAPAPSDTWYFGAAADGKDTDSWLSVLNPNDDIAAVEVRVSNPRGEASALLAEVSVPAGGIARIELAGASKDPAFGVAVNVVNSEPVVVARTVSLTSGDRRGVSGGLGAPALSSRWALVGAGTRGSDAGIGLYNPGAQDVTVTLTADGAPEKWQAIVLGPNGRTFLELSEAQQDRPSLPVLATADAPFVAELQAVATSGDELGLEVDVGIPEELWLGPPTRPPVRRNPSLSTSAGDAAPTEEPLLPEFDNPATQPAPSETAAPPSEADEAS